MRELSPKKSTPPDSDSDSESITEEYTEPFHRTLATESHRQNPLGPNTYGAAQAMLAHMFDQKGHFWSGTARYLLCLIQICGQSYLVYATYAWVSTPSVVAAQQIYDEFHEVAFNVDGSFDQDAFNSWDSRGDICKFAMAHPPFCFIILTIWTCSVMCDIKRTFYRIHDWARLERPVTAHDHLIDENNIIIRATLQLKIIVISTVFVPKFLIGVLLWWTGMRWLVTTMELSDVLLNACALEFVSRIDELLYVCFEPKELQSWVESHSILQDPLSDAMVLAEALEGRAKQEAQWEALMDFSAKAFCCSLTITILMVALYFYFNQALPNYATKVLPHCFNQIERQGVFSRFFA